MYKFLEYDWNGILNSDKYDFKCNHSRRVIELEAKRLPVGECYSPTSSLLIYYNVYTGQPFILIEHVTSMTCEEMKKVELPNLKGWVVSVQNDDEGIAGEVDIVLTRKALYDTIIKEEQDS